MPDLTQYALCVTHESLKRYGIDDYDVGKITVDIRGWDDRAQRPTYLPSYDFPLAKLAITAWYSEKFPANACHPSGTYGDTLGLDLGSDLLTLNSLTAYAKPLKSMQKKLDAIQAKYGYAKSVGQLLAYVAAALGITRFARPNEYYTNKWQSTTCPQDAIQWADSPIAAFHEQHKEANEESQQRTVA